MGRCASNICSNLHAGVSIQNRRLSSLSTSSMLVDVFAPMIERLLISTFKRSSNIYNPAL